MYEFAFTHEIAAPIERVWAVWSDMTSYPQWDPREQELRLDGPFAAGTTGYSKQRGNPGGPFTIVEVSPVTGWVNSSKLPGGELLITHRLEDLGNDRTRVTKTYRVTGPLEPLFRVWYAPTMRRSVPMSFEALAERIASTRGHSAE